MELAIALGLNHREPTVLEGIDPDEGWVVFHKVAGLHPVVALWKDSLLGFSDLYGDVAVQVFHPLRVILYPTLDVMFGIMAGGAGGGIDGPIHTLWRLFPIIADRDS
jgi:hypothetical protein